MGFPDIRMRDRRKDKATRLKYRETKEVSLSDLVMPIFVKEDIDRKRKVRSMPGIYQFPLKEVTDEAKRIHDSGIHSIILFGIPKVKDDIASSGYDDKGIVQEAIRAIKKALPKIALIADVCMCEYTSSGHCGIIKKSKRPTSGCGYPDQMSKSQTKNQKFYIDNDETVKILAKIALSYAKSGVDMVAPSAMMDGQVKTIKEILIKNNYPEIKIMSYSAKYASNFYGPFRDAAESPPQFGDRRTYQMDYYNSHEAILEAKLDIEEGADIIMVKPALSYLDIIYRIKKELNFPLAVYCVSGEYSMIKATASCGWLDEKKITLETLTSFKRAGADIIISYFAVDIAKWLTNE